MLKECGYNEGLLNFLNTDKLTGIVGTDSDLERRREMYGKNKITLPPITSFMDLLYRQFEDSNIQKLIMAGTVYTIFCLWLSDAEDGKSPEYEALTIFSGVALSTLICALFDYKKESQFTKIADNISKAKVTVFRGQHGTKSEILVSDLVVGDVIDVFQGDIVPADCILIDEMNIKVDESIYGTKDFVEKEPSSHEIVSDQGRDVVKDNHEDRSKVDNLLLTSSMIMSGGGKAVVCCVGSNTFLSRSRERSDKLIVEE